MNKKTQVEKCILCGQLTLGKIRIGRIRWDDLCGVGDAGCRCHYCSNLFSCRHLHEVHKLDDKNAAQVRLQMQLVNQLKVQVTPTFCCYMERKYVDTSGTIFTYTQLRIFLKSEMPLGAGGFCMTQ